MKLFYGVNELMSGDDLKVREYCFVPNLYHPIIIGDIKELFDRLEALRIMYPLTIELLLKILKTNQDQSFFLEDWFVVIPYQFIWQRNFQALKWFEEIFFKLFKYDQALWMQWLEDAVQKDKTTHAINDRLYSYLLQAYACIYLINMGLIGIKFEVEDKSGKNKVADIVAYDASGQLFVVECKFIKTSRKFESFFWRIHRAFKDCGKITSCEFLSSNFDFPPAESIKSLTHQMCSAVKLLLRNVYEVPNVHHVMYFNTEELNNLKIEYNPLLRSGSLISSQVTEAGITIDNFFNGPLLNTLKVAKKQLNQDIYHGYQKIIFLGIQFDSFYLIDWNSSVIPLQKQKIISKIKNEANIQVIFSDDVKFDMTRYL